MLMKQLFILHTTIFYLIIPISYAYIVECITHSLPSIAKTPSQLSWNFTFSEDTMPKDQFFIILNSNLPSIKTTSVNFSGKDSKDSEFTGSGSITHNIIKIVFDSSIISGTVTVNSTEEGDYAFNNPDDYDENFEIICSLNFVYNYTDYFRSTEDVPRIEMLKVGPYDSTPNSLTTFIYRFRLNSYTDGDIIKVIRHPEFYPDDQYECQLRLYSEDIVLNHLQCTIENDANDFCYNAYIQFPSFQQRTFRPYTVFQMEHLKLRNSWNTGKYITSMKWIKGNTNKLAAETFLYSFIEYNFITKFNSLDHLNSSHDEITSISIEFGISKQFNEDDSFSLQLIGFTLDPDDLTTCCTVASATSLEIDSTCDKNVENSIIKLSNLHEDVCEVSVLIDQIKNPSNNAAYIAQLYWFSLDTLLESKQLYISIQFSYFVLTPGNYEYEVTSISYSLAFEFYLPIEAGWFIIWELPEELSVAPSFECLLNDSFTSCALSSDNSQRLEIDMNLDVDQYKRINIQINGINNPSVAGTYDHFFYFMNQDGLKKAIKSFSIEYKCPSGYFLDDETSVCIHCDCSCKECFQNSKRCISCSDDAFWLINGYCVKECPGGTYAQDNECINCPFQCSACSVEEENLVCSTCFNHYFLNSDGRCELCQVDYCNECNDLVPTECRICENQYYLDENLECDSCDGNCFTCSDSSTNCLSCPTDYYLEGSSCVESCSINYTLEDNNCVVCETPSFKEAYFIDDFEVVEIEFSTLISVVSDSICGGENSKELCLCLFDTISTNKFGTTFSCVISEKYLKVYVDFTNSLVEGDSLLIKDEVLMKTGCPEFVMGSFSFNLGSEFEGSIPTANIKGPNTVNRNDLLTLRLANIFNQGHKPFKSVKWELNSIEISSSTDVESLLDDIFNECDTCTEITIGEGILEVGSYSFKTTITTWLNKSNVIYSKQIKVEDRIIPIPVPEINDYYYINNTDSLLLKARFTVNNTADINAEKTNIADFTFSWKQFTQLSLRKPIDFTQNYHELYIETMSLYSTSESSPYIFQVTINKTDDPQISTYIQYTVQVYEDKPKCNLFGVGPKSQNQVIRLTAEKSSDPTSQDIELSSYDLSYIWTCKQCKFSNGSPVPKMMGREIEFDPRVFNLKDELEFEVTCSNSNSSSTDSGIVSINTSQYDYISLNCPYYINAFYHKKTAVTCELDLSSLTIKSPKNYQFQWKTDIDSQYQIIGNTMPFFLIDENAIQDGTTYHLHLLVSTETSRGEGEFELYSEGHILPGIVNISSVENTRTGGFEETLEITVSQFSYHDSTCKLEYVFFWALNSTEPIWQYIAESYSTTVTTTFKPCKSLLFLVKAYDCLGNTMNATSEVYENGVGCDTPSYDKILENADPERSKQLIETINSALYIFEETSQHSVQDIKQAILSKIQLFHAKKSGTKTMDCEYNRLKSQMLYRIFKDADGITQSMIDDGLLILNDIIELESEFMLNKGTTDPLYLDLLDYSDVAQGLTSTEIEYIFQILDIMTDFLISEESLRVNNRNDTILDLIMSLSKSLTKNIFPFENADGISIKKNNFNFTVVRDVELQLKSHSYEFSQFKFEIGNPGFFKSSLASFSYIYLFFMGEFELSFFETGIEIPLTSRWDGWPCTETKL